MSGSTHSLVSAMDLVVPYHANRVIARLLVAALAVTILVLALTPWQQSAQGAGAWSPTLPRSGGRTSRRRSRAASSAGSCGKGRS